MSKDRYVEDTSINQDYYDEGLISSKKLIIGSAIAAGSTIAYKKGLLKPLIKEGIELTSEHKPLLSIGFNETRRWLKSNEGVNKNSLFRQNLKSIASSIMKQDEDVALDVIKAIKEDLGLFTKMFNDTLDRVSNGGIEKSVINNYTNTGLLNEGKRGISEVNKYSQQNAGSKATMKSKVYDAVFSKYHKTDEQLSEQLKKTGYRQVTLSDMFEHEFTKEGHLKLYESTRFNFSTLGEDGERIIPKHQLENMLNHTMITDNGNAMYKGKRAAKFKDKFKLNNITLDESLLIDEAGNIVDLRGKKKEITTLINNLATEWKIPVKNVNPLGMIGLDKVGRPKTNFGFISEHSIAPALTGKRGNSIENTIKNVKKFDERLKDVKEGVMIIDGDVYTIGNGKSVKKLDYKYKKDIFLVPKNKAHNTGSLTHLENAQRKIMGISNSKYKDYSKADGDKYTKQKIAKLFDIGRQESRVSKNELEGVMGYSSPDNYVEKFLSKLGGGLKPYESKEEFRNFTEMMTPGVKSGTEDTLFVTNKSISLKDIKVNGFNKEIVKDYALQYVADFNRHSELVNNKTGVLHFLADRMNSSISSVGLGLSLDSSSGAIASATNLVAKRFLPVYGAYQGWNMLNAITEGEKGQRTNLNRTIWEGVSRLDVGASYVRDKLGITKFTKNLTKLMSGYDQIEELPGINALNFHESAQERKDYWEHGKDAVRKGRYWTLNTSTSFTGGKVDYFKLNPLQAAKSDAVFSDSQFGSRREYFANILNPYHYDNKHYMDRPYLKTSPAFENVPIIGDTLASTVGKVIKPQIKMHKEYWNGDDAKTSQQIKGDQAIADIQQQRMVSSGVSNIMIQEAGQTVQNVYQQTFGDRIKGYTDSARRTAVDLIKSVNAKLNKFSDRNLYDNTEQALIIPKTAFGLSDKMRDSFGKTNTYRNLRGLYYNSDLAYQPKEDFKDNQIPLVSDMVPTNQQVGDTILALSDGDGVKPTGMLSSRFQRAVINKSGVQLGKAKDFESMMKFDKTDDLSNQNMIYRTGSGVFSIVNTGKETNPLTKVNTDKESAKSFLGSKDASLTNNYIVNSNDLDNSKEKKIEKPNGFISTIKNQKTDTANVAGIYGFGFNSAITGEIQKGRTVIDTPGYSRSFNKTFWDKDLGGFGGDISEIFRRLVQKRASNGVNYYNPIKNTMPDWLPGEGSFVDFQHGDPYSKIERGEERLPGEGYERAYGINIDDYTTSSSKLGKSREELIEHFLRRDNITDEDSQEIVRKGTRTHEMVEKYMMEHGVAIDVEKEIWDKKNNISGIYDVRMKDSTSETGESIVDIKTINDKGFKKVLETGLPKEEHMKQVNFYLHNTDKRSNGGVLYVNRDDPTQMKMVTFKYSKQMYDEVIGNVNYARNEVKKAIDSGQISRAERYRPIDKLRILGDVAPYSQEYNDMLKYVRSMDLSDEQKSRVQQIEDMVSQQRKQLRTYDYRFKTADVITKKVKIERQVEDDKFMTNGFDDPIKLAGIDLPSKTDNEERHQKAMAFINKNIKGNVKIQVAEDEHLRNNKDSLHTMNAVVYANGMNINRELIKRGLADEKEKDFSAAGVHARFNSLQRNFGSAWETIAHQNTIVNNRILRVRSAKEDYERQQVYNKDFKSWTHPIQDFLIPSIWGAMADETTTDRVVGTVVGAAAGSFFGMASKNKYGRVIGLGAGASLGAASGTSILAGAFIGGLFGGAGPKNKFGRLMGASVGASIVAGAKAYKVGYEAKTGKKWIPKEKRRENEVVEYLDKLEFVKDRRLFEVYAQKALKEDGIDVRKLLSESKDRGDKSKSWSSKANKIKREQKKSGKFNTREYEKIGLKFNDNDKKYHLLRKDESNEKERSALNERKFKLRIEKAKLFKEKLSHIKEQSEYMLKHDMHLKPKSEDSSEKEIKKQKKKIISRNKSLSKATKTYMENSKNRKQKALERTVNQSIEKSKASKEIMMTSPNAMKAIEYYNKSESTMYGYDPGENISNFVKALPKKDKKYFNEFLKAGEKERKEILKIAPKYMKRALQSSYGMKVDEKESLTDYFSDHYLPDENWDGWQESYDFDSIKTKVISREGFNLASHDIWEDNKNNADMYGATPIPNINHRTKDIQAVKNQLMSVLGQAGYKDLDISVMSGAISPGINLDMYEDKKEKFENKIRERIEK